MLATLHRNEESVERLKNIIKEEFPDRDLSYMIPEEEIIEGGFFPECQKICIDEIKDLTYEEEFFIDNEIQERMKEEGLSFLQVLEKYPRLSKEEYGVADNYEQIMDYFKEEIEDPDNTYAVMIGWVYQDKDNAGKGGGWRWHKWGPYIGTLEPECEYLDDEDFGDDWQGYVITFHLLKLKK